MYVGVQIENRVTNGDISRNLPPCGACPGIHAGGRASRLHGVFLLAWFGWDGKVQPRMTVLTTSLDRRSELVISLHQLSGQYVVTIKTKNRASNERLDKVRLSQLHPGQHHNRDVAQVRVWFGS